MINHFKLFLPTFCLWLVCNSGFAQATNEAKERWPASVSNETTARRCFIETERIARMPKAEQAKQIAHVYHDLFLSLEMRPHSMIVEPAFPMNRNDLTPEQAADALAGDKMGWVALFEAGRENCLALLQTNINVFVPLVKEDLAGTNDDNVKRGIRAASAFHLGQLFEDLVAVFQKNDKLALYAAYALRDLNDPRAIRILVERFPDRPTEYFEALLHLQHGRKADPALLRLLDSKDARIRWQATYALRESGDLALVPVARKLFKDSEAIVREHAAIIPFLMPEAGFIQLRPDLVALLNDPNARVRYQVAVCFASRKDDVCARALLGLLREKGLEEWIYSNVIQSVNTLAGSYFGYSLDQPPTSRTNQAAADRFAAWIKEHRK